MMKRYLLLVAVILCCAMSVFAGNANLPWKIILIPDTQNYTQQKEDIPRLTAMIDWIKQNKEKENIKIVLHLGDYTNNNTKEQWRVIKDGMSILDGYVPYVCCLGNHDLGENGRTKSRETYLNTYFKITDNPLNQELLVNVYEKGKPLNNATFAFTQYGKKYLVLSLEFGPRDEVLEWANKIVSSHSDHNVILVTHDFIDERSTFSSKNGKPLRSTTETSGNARGYLVGNTGEEIWQKLISKHKNFFLVVNGHYLDWEKDKDGKVVPAKGIAAAHRSDKVEGGKTVHQILFNAQWTQGDNKGWIQSLEFNPSNNTVSVKTFSPYLEKLGKTSVKTGEQFEFKLQLD